MAYDALIAKWPSLTGASAPASAVAAARAALATAAPVDPGFGATAGVYAAYVTALQAWHMGYAAVFYDPAVTAELAQLDAITENGAQRPVDIASAVAYLREQGIWLAIKASANPAAQAVVDLYGDPRAQTLDFTLPVVGQTMAALIAAGLVSQAQANALEAMSFEQIPWWQANGYTSPIAATDLEAVFVASSGQTALV